MGKDPPPQSHSIKNWYWHSGEQKSS